MEKEKQRYFEEVLNKLKKERLESLYDEELGYRSELREVTSELSTYDNHPGDLGTETFEAEKNLSFRNNDKTVLNEVQDALTRIENGSYGKCEGCGAEINEERLEFIPYARYCIECEKEKEKHQVTIENGRPIEEQVLNPPFGRSDNDNSIENRVEFDGEDAWESVAIFNSYTYAAEDEIDNGSGYVEDVERISNQQYKKTLD